MKASLDQLIPEFSVRLGGNDYPVEKSGVLSIKVPDPEEVERVIVVVIASLDGATGFDTEAAR